MKKAILFFVFTLISVMLIGCTSNPPENAPESHAVKFSAADYDLSGVRSVKILSGDGKTVLLTDKAAIDALVSAVSPLTAEKPITSRGFYGWTYRLDFYTTDSPAEGEDGVLSFTLSRERADDPCLIHGFYEEVEGFRYKALYTDVDKSAVDAIESLCAQYMP
ncbi:MAG: hypothetical protein E7662_11285 [Ruminococcaceae bacterium]|nr:hypothetical protein [Oscillospiraceae bacterium]